MSKPRNGQERKFQTKNECKIRENVHKPATSIDLIYNVYAIQINCSEIKHLCAKHNEISDSTNRQFKAFKIIITFPTNLTYMVHFHRGIESFEQVSKCLLEAKFQIYGQ